MLKPEERLIVALDTTSIGYAYHLIDILKQRVKFYKIGHSLIHLPGIKQLIEDIKSIGGQIFYDAKLFDTPHTIKNAIYGIKTLNVDYISVLNRPEIINSATEAAANSQLKILVLAQITSIHTLETIPGKYNNISGLILPGEMHSATKNFYKNYYNCNTIFSPGIRLNNNNDDHLYICTPKQAIQNGSDYVIVGRPIIESADPIKEVDKYIENISSTFHQ